MYSYYISKINFDVLTTPNVSSTVLDAVLSFAGGNVCGIILGTFLSIAAYNIKTKCKRNQLKH